MADITKCEGIGCEVKDKCYRHTAPLNEHRQSFFIESPGINAACDYFWPKE